MDVLATRYGVCGGAGGCAYGDPHNNGFQEILTASLTGALELGAFVYAQGVLENYLRFYVKERGTIACECCWCAMSSLTHPRVVLVQADSSS